MEEFFKKLKEIRSKSPFTQQQMSDKLGISLKQYQNYEKKTIPPHDKLLKLNEILNFNFSKVLYQEKVPLTENKKILKEYTSYDGSSNIVSEPFVEYLKTEVKDLKKQNIELHKKIAVLEDRISKNDNPSRNLGKAK